MKITIIAKNFLLDQFFKRYVENKINSLEKFSKIFQNNKKNVKSFLKKEKPKAEALVEIGRITMHHKKGLIFFAQCKLIMPGRSLIAKTESKDLREAINFLKEDLERELKQYKERKIALDKRKARIFKKELKIAPEARFYRKGRIREEGV